MRRLRYLHRIVGLVSVVFVLLLSITGILLNHTEELQLNKRYVRFQPLLSLYGVQAPSLVSFIVDNHRITQLGQQVYHNKTPLSIHLKAQEKLVAASVFTDFYVIASQQRIWLLTPDFEVIETIGEAQSLPTPLLVLSHTENHLYIDTESGIYRTDSDFLAWEKVFSHSGKWIKSYSPNRKLKAYLLQRYQGDGLPWERVLLDLHSGRILGYFGVLLMDLAAILLIFLTLTGVWMWWRVSYPTKYKKKLKPKS